MKIAQENQNVQVNGYKLYLQAYSITTYYQILQVHIIWSSSKFNTSEQQHSNSCASCWASPRVARQKEIDRPANLDEALKSKKKTRDTDKGLPMTKQGR